MMHNNQSGQTLIETVVAIFILVMGMVASVGLAIYVFANSTSVTRQIIATGLAREGVEAFKNMRDTNWLFTSVSTDCYNFVSGLNNAKCYKEWLKGDPGSAGAKKGYNIDPGNNTECYRIKLQPNANNDGWQYNKDNCNSNKWGLDYQVGFGNNFEGIYSVSNLNQGVEHGTSNFYRKIILEKDSTSPFNNSNLQKFKVTVQVWWVDKKCPRKNFWPGSGKCSLELKTHFTNWRDY